MTKRTSTNFVTIFHQGFVSIYLVNFLSVGASLSKSSPSTRGLTEHDIAAAAQYHSLGMTENSCNLETSGTLDIHKE
jgi:hypothetical protein